MFKTNFPGVGSRSSKVSQTAVFSCSSFGFPTLEFRVADFNRFIHNVTNALNSRESGLQHREFLSKSA